MLANNGNLGGVGFIAYAGEKHVPRGVEFEGRLEQLATLLLNYSGTRIGVCDVYTPTEASQSDSNK